MKKLLAFGLAMVVAGLIVPASPAAAAGYSQITSNTSTYDCVDGTKQCTTNRYTAVSTLRGTMVCFRDGRREAGTVRFFYMRFDNGKEGFVPATRVNPQSAVNNCSDSTTSNSLLKFRRGVWAADWALGRNGDVSISAADQKIVSAGCSASCTKGDWSGDCSGFVYAAYKSIGITINFADARKMWDAYPVSRRNYDRSPPRGALVFWNASSGGKNFGHVEISLGNGRSIGTTGWDSQRLPVEATAISASSYLGWVMP